jgi:myo-inositol-1(or 4)-monophosphatase
MTNNHSQSEILERIHAALLRTKEVFARFTPGEVSAQFKAKHDPVTEADHAVNAVLHKCLLRDGEGWLSEESADDHSRLGYARIWVVDPLDGTREFVAGIPEFCASIAFVENGSAVAGGILNPATDETFLGSLESGVSYNGAPVETSQRDSLAEALVLASRSEVKRGEWERFRTAPFRAQPTGSVAYKLARVAAGLADATFTLSPKHEWDIAAGVALVSSGGGFARPLDQAGFVFNQPTPLSPGMLACGANLRDELVRFLGLSSQITTVTI